ncbi:MFS transporter [Pseudaestuariivita sp.]|uniref:MFS transporter n=1 Tax=Pseudaestuariivita sp. TaxID=2211669 RepID=UPI00405822F1
MARASKLTQGQKIGWGLADMGIVVFVVIKQLLIVAFLNTVLGVPVETAGLVATLVLVFDIVTDPLVGYLSDRTSTRWGRRAPWMVGGAVLLAGAMVGLFSAPLDGTPTASLVWVTGFFVLATIGFTMVAIPYGASAGEITQDPRTRSTLTAWRMVFASIGILIGGAVFPGLAKDLGHATAALIAAPLVVLPVWLSVFATRKAPRILVPAQTRFGDTLRLVLANRAFMVLVGCYGVMTLAVALITAGLPFAALYLITDDGSTLLSGAAETLTVLSLMFATFVVGSILSQAIWVLVSARIGKLWALVVGLSLYIALLLTLFSMLPSANVTLISGMFVLAGMTNGAYQQIPWAIYPDLMDRTRAQSGEAIEGAFSALWLLGQKVANAIAPLVLGLLLASAGWQETTEGTTVQTGAALEMLHWTVTLIPAAIMAVSILGLVLVYRPAARAS